MYENAQRLKSDTELILCMHYYLLYIYIQYEKRENMCTVKMEWSISVIT